MSLEMLHQADYVLSNCGRPMPPPGARWVDLPYVLTYLTTNTKTARAFVTENPADGINFVSTAAPGVVVTISIVSGGALTVVASGQKVTITTNGFASTLTAIVAAIVASGPASALIKGTVTGNGADTLDGQPWTLTVVQGSTIGIGAAATRIENKARVQFLVRGVSVNGTVGPYRVWWANGRNLEQLVSGGSFTGSGAGLRVIQPEVPIDPAGKIIIESGANASSTGGSAFFYFWGVLRFPLVAKGNEPEPYIPDTSRAPRIPGTQNQNIMAPEWMLGNQCTPETPEGFWDEPYTLYSSAIANPIGTTTVGVAVECPRDCESFIVRNVQYNSVADGGVSAGVAALQIRMPSGYSLTNGDYLPADWTGPLFPLLMVKAGGRIILDVGDMDTAGTGNITTTVQFDGVKRRRLQ